MEYCTWNAVIEYCTETVAAHFSQAVECLLRGLNKDLPTFNCSSISVCYWSGSIFHVETCTVHLSYYTCIQHHRSFVFARLLIIPYKCTNISTEIQGYHSKKDKFVLSVYINVFDIRYQLTNRTIKFVFHISI